MKFWLWGVFFCICTVIILHNIKSCVSVKLIKRKIHLYDILSTALLFFYKVFCTIEYHLVVLKRRLQISFKVP